MIFLNKYFLPTILCYLLFSMALTSQANANIFNKFRQGFYFEKYKNTKEAEEALLKLHPIGSNADEMIKALEKAGCECKEIDGSKLVMTKKNNQQLKNLTSVIHCENLINFVMWRASILVNNKEINDIGINKEYMGL